MKFGDGMPHMFGNDFILYSILATFNCFIVDYSTRVCVPSDPANYML